MVEIKKSRKKIVLAFIVMAIIVVSGVSAYAYVGHSGSVFAPILKLGVVPVGIADNNSYYGPLTPSVSYYTPYMEYLPLMDVPYVNATVAYYNGTLSYPFVPVTVMSIHFTNGSAARGFFLYQWGQFNDTALMNSMSGAGGSSSAKNGTYHDFEYFIGYYYPELGGVAGSYVEYISAGYSGQYGFIMSIFEHVAGSGPLNMMDAEIGAMTA